MMKKVLGLIALAGVCLAFTGCNAIQGYSVRSYQGPLPMHDYQYLNQESVAVAAAAH